MLGRAVAVVTVGIGLVLASGFADAKTIKGTAKSDLLKGTKRPDIFYGYAGNDRMIGGEDILGIGGKDVAYGGRGNDTYEIFGEPGDFRLVEKAGQGNDTWIPTGRVGARQIAPNIYKPSPWVKTTAAGDQRAVIRLPRHVENLVSRVWNGAPSDDEPTVVHVYQELHGTPANNVMTGDDRDASNDGWVKAAVSHDRIYGYAGDDTFRYGLGSDEYIGGEGWDTIDLRLARVSALISAEAEFLVNFKSRIFVYGGIRGGKWAGAISTFDGIEAVILSRGIDEVKGDANANFMVIDAGDRAGGDRIWADDGNDTLVVKRGYAGYKHVFYYGGNGFDLLDFSDFQTPVTMDLGSSEIQHVNGYPGFQLLSVEAVYGGAKSDHLSGNSALTEVFRPGRGNDVIKGDNTPRVDYTNVDYIYFDTPLNAKTNVDMIVDVKTEADGRRRLEDILYLDHRIFSKILDQAPTGAAYLSPSRFKMLGSGSVDSDDRVLVDQAAGKIFYDPDGSGPKAAVLFARVTPGISATANNFATY